MIKFLRELVIGGKLKEELNEIIKNLETKNSKYFDELLNKNIINAGCSSKKIVDKFLYNEQNIYRF